MKTERITLAHGNGGRYMRELIQETFISTFNNSFLNEMSDAAEIPAITSSIKITTDGYTVDPLIFPGGDIGKLSMCGTINDLVVSGAIPLYFTVNFFIEEGFEISLLKKITHSMQKIAEENSITIVAGDTKVLPRGAVNGLYIATTGIGNTVATHLSSKQIKTGNKIYTTGTLGDHGAAVLLARSEFGLTGPIISCCGSVLDIGKKLMQQTEVKFMRDPTRGGVATVCHEIIEETGIGITLFQNKLPIQEGVKSFCDILGFDPLYLASEGRIIFITDGNWQPDNTLENIVEIGIIEATHTNLILETTIGGQRIIPELEGDPLPRIC